MKLLQKRKSKKTYFKNISIIPEITFSAEDPQQKVMLLNKLQACIQQKRLVEFETERYYKNANFDEKRIFQEEGILIKD